MALSQSLVVSVLLHAAVVGAFTWAARERHEPALPPALSSAEPDNAAFGGETFDVEALVDAPPAQRTEAAAQPVAPTTAEPAPPPKPKGETSRARERRTRRERPAAPPTESTTSVGDPSEPQPDADRGASYGAADLPPGVRHLAPAFTRAIAAATNRDPFWATLPIGSVGKTRVIVDVDDEGHLARVPRDNDEPELPALERLVDRTLLLLRAGRFALSRRKSGAGREILEIDVTLSMVPPPEGDWDDPAHTAKMGFVPPEPGKPGRAFFVHGSGRRFDAQVTIVLQKAR